MEPETNTVVFYNEKEIYLKSKGQFNSNLDSLTFPILDTQTKIRFDMIIIPQKTTREDLSSLVPQIVANFENLSHYEHPNILNFIETYPRTFAKMDMEHWEKMENGKIFLDKIHPSGKVSLSLEATCIKTQHPSGPSLTLWIDLFRSRKHDPMFQNIQVTIIQNVIDRLKFLHEKSVFHGNLSPSCVHLSGDTPPVKICLVACDTATQCLERKYLRDLGKIIQTVIEMSNSTTSLDSEDFHAIVTHPFIANAADLVRHLVSTGQEKHGDKNSFESIEKVNLESKDNQTARILSILKNPNGHEWFEHGAFGMVLSAYDKNLKIMTAVKLIVSKKKNETDKERQKREFQNLKDLRHNNLVHVLQLREKQLDSEQIKELPEDYEDDFYSGLKLMLEENAKGFGIVDVICIEMELCGSTLRCWLDSRADDTNNSKLLLFNTQLRIISDVLSGVRYLHYKNIIHRDLKPGNVFYASHQKMFPLKIGDFGLSRTLESPEFLETQDEKNDDHSNNDLLAEMTSSVGTPAYQAPEVRTGRYGKPADIYSLGLIIWEVLQLHTKMSTAQRRSTFMELVYGGDTSLIKDCPEVPNLKETIKMTKTKVAERIQTIYEVQLIATEIWAKSSEELEAYLKTFQSGITIHLVEAVYTGYFIFYHSGVKLIGEGENTIVTNGDATPLVLPNDVTGCTIKNLKLKACGISWAESTLRVDGNNNLVENIHIDNKSGKGDCLRIEGSGNHVFRLRARNSEVGILIEGERANANVLDDIEISNCNNGIKVFGFYPGTVDNNRMKNCTLRNVIKGVSVKQV